MIMITDEEGRVFVNSRADLPRCVVNRTRHGMAASNKAFFAHGGAVRRGAGQG